MAFFIGDAAFTADPKFRRLARLLPDPDEFNSAVGAFWIALAAARRNGVPDIDVDEETQSRYVGHLREAGLLTESGFRPEPFKVWGPSRPKYPSDLRPAPSAPSAPNDSEVTDDSESARRTPPPLPSPLVPSSTGGTGGSGLPHINSTVAGIWEQATGRTVLAAGAWVQGELDNLCRRLPPSEVGAAIIRARREYGDRIPDERALVMTMLKLPGVGAHVTPTATEDTTKRSAAAKRQLQLTKHSGGHHIDAADPDCPKCQEGAA